MTNAKRVMLTILIAGSSGLAAFAQQRPGSAKDRLVGAWGLVSFVSFDANGASRPGAYDLGRIVYDASGQMSAHLMHSSNKADAPPTTDADRSAAFRRYLGYYGPFTVDELTGIVIHQVVGSSNPSWVGGNQVRYFGLSEDGNTLTLSVKNQGRVTATLVWERIK
jgi:Lipocalin-like domain